MSTKEFMQAVDELSEQMNIRELRTILRQIARKVPEKDRDKFYDFLMITAGSPDRSETGAGADNMAPGSNSEVRLREEKEKQALRSDLKELTSLFEKIREGNLCYSAEGYEEYPYGGWESDWSYVYSDKDGIGEIYEHAYEVLDSCVDACLYEEALELFDLIVGTEAFANDTDGGDTWELSLDDMVSEGLVHIDLDSLAVMTLYAAYQSSEPDERPETLYRYFKENQFFRDVKPEKMLQAGSEELTGLDAFWKGWILLLANRPGDMESRLLREAVECGGNTAELLPYARLSCAAHPSVYLDAMEEARQKGDHEREIAIGKEALERMDKKLIIRSEAALKLAEAAEMLGEEDLADECRKKAFESHTTCVNALRVQLENQDPESGKKYLCDVVSAASIEPWKTETANKELSLNVLTEFENETLRFFTGDFARVRDHCLTTKEGLGWSGTFTGMGINLFLLLLKQGEGMPQACGEILCDVRRSLAFEKKEYIKGTKGVFQNAADAGDTRTEDAMFFWNCFCRWRAGWTLVPEQTEKWFADLERLIDLRVKAIVSGKHRNHYGRAALLAAALGEVRESMGEAGAKQEILQKYRKEFPRHSSFHAALRSYGMRR